MRHCGDLIPFSSGIEGLANLFINIFSVGLVAALPLKHCLSQESKEAKKRIKSSVLLLSPQQLYNFEVRIKSQLKFADFNRDLELSHPLQAPFWAQIWVLLWRKLNCAIASPHCIAELLWCKGMWGKSLWCRWLPWAVHCPWCLWDRVGPCALPRLGYRHGRRAGFGCFPL